MADIEAENAIREAFAHLTQCRKRAYSLSVPEEATQILFQKGKGRLTIDDASSRCRKAIVDMKVRGDLDAPDEPRVDWRLLN
jgi:hypothetical protein